MSLSWRLIQQGPASGGWNMGIDEALLATAIAGTPTLRLYSWDGPWLSLGYAQPCSDALERRCREAGVGLVRRATGGRAVLHGGDLSYSIAAPEGVLPPGLQGAYGKVSDVLLRAIQALGVAADRAAGEIPPERPDSPDSPDRPDPCGGPGAASPAGDGRSRPPQLHEPDASHGFDCFQAAAADEICLAGSKLAGSAQRRAGKAVLQHGSIRLRPDPPAASRAAGLVGTGATSLREEGHEIAEAALRQALVDAFRSVFAVSVVPDFVSPAEESIALARVRQHARAPYARPQLPA